MCLQKHQKCDIPGLVEGILNEAKQKEHERASVFVGNKDTHGLNSKRLAEVWMDDYKRLFYGHRSDMLVSLLPPGKRVVTMVLWPYMVVMKLEM